MDALAPAATAGGRAVVKINPLAKDLIKSHRILDPVIYPPMTPYAFPRVPSIRVILSESPNFSEIPPPLGPYKPTA